MPTVLISASSLLKTCPLCEGKTRYRRLGYDGERGEGPWCDNCKKFVPHLEVAFVAVEVDENRKITETGQKQIKEFRKRISDLVRRERGDD